MTSFPGSIGTASPHLAEFSIFPSKTNHSKNSGNTAQTSSSLELLVAPGCKSGYSVALPTISSGAPLCVRFSHTSRMSNTANSDGSLAEAKTLAEAKIEVNLNRLTRLAPPERQWSDGPLLRQAEPLRRR
jgi:hypothetical protein